MAANPGLTPAFSSGNDFGFDWTAGPDVTIDRRTASGNIWDARFFNNYESATNQFVSPGAFIGAGFTGPGGTNFLAHYATKLDSFELNWEHPLTDQFLFLAGFRAIDLDDDLVYHLNTTVATGDYGYRNHLYGGQLGGDWALTGRGNPLQISVVGKAGIYSNSSEGGITQSAGGTPIQSFLGTGSTTAFVGELDISAAYIFSRHWAIRGGYQLLWLDDLALASDAASRSLTNPALLRTVSSNGDLFYNGATAAIDFIW